MPSERKKICQAIAEKEIIDLQGRDIKRNIEIVDSYSGFFEIIGLHQGTSSEVISSLQKEFSVHGIPYILESDNGPQYSSKEFREFARSCNCSHVSTPRYAQLNGLSERYIITSHKVYPTQGVYKNTTMIAQQKSKNQF